MKFLYSLGGGNIPVIREFDIDSKTKFESGKVVRISTDGIIGHGSIGGCIGVAAEDHTAEKDILNERNNGNKLRIDITRDAVYSVPAMKLTATSGSETTLICSSEGLAASISSGTLVLVQKGENSENTDSVGSERKVQSVSISSGNATVTIDDGARICAGDVYAFFPTYGFKGVVADDCSNFAFAGTNVVTELYVVNYDKKNLTLEVMLKKDYIA